MHSEMNILAGRIDAEEIAKRAQEVREDMAMQVLLGYPAGTVTNSDGNPERNITAESTLVKDERH